MKVSLEKPQVRSVNENGIVAEVLFADPRPNDDWIKLFRSLSFPMSLEEPEFGDNKRLVFQVEAPRIEQYVEALKRRVAQANEEYERVVVPGRKQEDVDLEARIEREEAEKREAQRRLDEAL